MAKIEIKGESRGLVRLEALPIILVYIVIVVVFMITAPETFLRYRIYQSFMSTVLSPLISAARPASLASQSPANTSRSS